MLNPTATLVLSVVFSALCSIIVSNICCYYNLIAVNKLLDDVTKMLQSTIESILDCIIAKLKK